jgi:hypothetical protein
MQAFFESKNQGTCTIPPRVIDPMDRGGGKSGRIRNVRATHNQRSNQ